MKESRTHAIVSFLPWKLAKCFVSPEKISKIKLFHKMLFFWFRSVQKWILWHLIMKIYSWLNFWVIYLSLSRICSISMLPAGELGDAVSKDLLYLLHISDSSGNHKFGIPIIRFTPEWNFLLTLWIPCQIIEIIYKMIKLSSVHKMANFFLVSYKCHYMT